MNRSIFTRLITIACLTALAGFAGVACGPGTNGNNGGGSGPASADAFEDETSDLLARTLCEAVYQCPQEQNPGTTTFLSRYGDEATCEQEILQALGDEFDFDFASSVEQGLSEYNRDKAKECLDEFDRLTQDACFSFEQLENAPAEACEQVVTGLQPDGEACDSDQHCASGNCDTNVDTGACYDGNCAPAMTEEPVIKAVGEDCSAENDICDPDADIVCDVADDGESRICVAEDSRAEGTVCRSAAVCNAGLACVSQECTAVVLNAEGEACDLQETYCEPGLICDFSAGGGITGGGSCAPPKAEGEECFSNFSCEAGLQCDGVDQVAGTPGTCQPKLGEGEACQSDLDCQNDLSCQGETTSTCEAPEQQQSCDIPVAN